MITDDYPVNYAVIVKILLYKISDRRLFISACMTIWSGAESETLPCIEILN
ncbi:hypothetical protein SAMN05421747_11040 [Parapedobacter composti]|uniref:Uncharacterized protein n=1 Tax=Parapedobacter composti TaxID=623281 RepID=A0A1I1ITF5_9SPHI|nr:hypothetical protein SAMN05421747_11040 [Parapedobacter composti]